MPQENPFGGVLRPPAPPLKWAGGKRWLVPHLAPVWAGCGDRTLVEPFCGGLSVALGLRPRTAILRDINPHVINFYQCLQQGLVPGEHVVMENDPKVYAKNRQHFNDLVAAGEAHGALAASLFFYLNRTGFNGLCRFNSRGFYNVPFGKYKSIGYDSVNFGAYPNVLKDWMFETGDFRSFTPCPRSFLYVDPPYDVEFTRYSAQDFDWHDQEGLAAWAASHPGPCVASNQATSRILSLYLRYGFSIWITDGPRRISCTGDRTPAKEIIAVRNIPEQLHHHLDAFALRSAVSS